ncbi:MAG TPA: hypothetical protein VK978_02890 [Candidatus Saccharimonadales bacterium]|nr:hypothetical protein [Candidatus Saccharimonadales bacterium]
MRYGKDDQDTHESMQLRRYERKYMIGQKVRHSGENRLHHRNKKTGNQ